MTNWKILKGKNTIKDKIILNVLYGQISYKKYL